MSLRQNSAAPKHAPAWAALAESRWLRGAAISVLASAVSICACVPLRSPVRLTLMPKGKLAVSEPDWNRVVIVDSAKLKVVDEIDIRRPLGVAWGWNRLLVGNGSTQSIQIYQRHRGGRWSRGNELGGKKLPVPEPSDIAVDETRNLVFVLSAGRKSVMVFSIDGSFLRAIGQGPIEAERLLNPTGVEVDVTRQEVLVSDYGDPRSRLAARVRIYDYAGNHLAEIRGDSRQDGFEFSRPQGLVSDHAGHIFIVDALLGKVLVFDRATLKGVKTLGSYGSEPGQLMLPLDVAIDTRSMDVLVTNNRPARIEMFEQGAVVP
ncbi:MAG: hypothetical protein V3U86_09050 [Acidobacteriota bacterium]